MNKIIFILTLSAFLFTQQAEVTNIQAAQRTDGSKIVDITYDLSEDEIFIIFDIIAEVSFDGGANWINIDIADGDIGYGIEAGNNKTITWHFGNQLIDHFSDDAQIKILATSHAVIENNNEQEVPFELVTIPQGEFTFGVDNTPILIDYDYQIMKYEVTNAQYAAFLIYLNNDEEIEILDGYFNADVVFGFYTGDGFIPPGQVSYIDLINSNIHWDGNSFYVDEGFGQNPVTGVTWFGAWAFSSYYGMRLPTEKEWEKAARGNTGNIYPWGNTLQSENANVWNSGDPWDQITTPVGSYNGTEITPPPATFNFPGNFCILPSNQWGLGVYDCFGDCIEIRGVIAHGGSGTSSCSDQFNCEVFNYDGCDCGCSEDFDCSSIGLYEDCDGQCIGQEYLSWLGDTFCDCGAWGIDFCCDEWNFDSGDCGGGRDSETRPYTENSANNSRQTTIDSPSPYGVYDLEGNVSEWTSTIQPTNDGEEGIVFEGIETGTQYILQYKKIKGSSYNSDAGNPAIYNYYHTEICNYNVMEIDDINNNMGYDTFCEGSHPYLGFRSVRTVE